MKDSFKWAYLSKTRGIGGIIKEQLEDFIVKEKASHKINGNNHLILKMTKYNLTTLEALRELSNILHVPLKIFGYAGNKDKRAITTQYISAKNLEEEHFKRVFISNIDLEVLGRGKHISLGQLDGNSFEVVIRKITLPKEEVEKRVLNIWKELNGKMPNYFGNQRFGTTRPITHKIGYEILRGNYEKAVWLYIGKAFENEPERIKKVRKELWESRDPSKGAEKFPKRYIYEKILLYHLAKRPTDYVGAIKQLPLGLQKLFVHAYQAYIFNNILSELVSEGFREPYELPLIGYKTVLKENKAEKKVKNLLKKEKISLEAFKLKDLPHLRLEGSNRPCFTEVKNFRILKVSDDELNIDKHKIKLAFELGKGSYATSFLREFMKT